MRLGECCGRLVREHKNVFREPPFLPFPTVVTHVVPSQFETSVPSNWVAFTAFPNLRSFCPLRLFCRWEIPDTVKNSGQVAWICILHVESCCMTGECMSPAIRRIGARNALQRASHHALQSERRFLGLAKVAPSVPIKTDASLTLRGLSLSGGIKLLASWYSCCLNHLRIVWRITDLAEFLHIGPGKNVCGIGSK